MKIPLGRLRALGLRATSGRLRVLQTVEHAPMKGMGVEQVYHELARNGTPLSLASVYRIMKDLTEEGVFSRSWSGEADDIKYAYWLRSEADAACDNQIVCGRCQRTVRLDNPALEDDILRQAQKGGLIPGSLQFTIQVTCMECAVAQKTEPPLGPVPIKSARCVTARKRAGKARGVAGSGPTCKPCNAASALSGCNPSGTVAGVACRCCSSKGGNFGSTATTRRCA